MSEESREDFYTEFAFTGLGASKIQNLKIMAEHETAFQTLDEMLTKIEFFITEHKLDIFIFDNLTTCKIYENSKPATQAHFASRLKEICRKREIPFLIVCHTGAMQELNTRARIDLNAIRGSKTVANLAEFAYTIQAVYKNDQRMTLLCIAKSRGQPVKNNTFELFYYPARRVFGKAEARTSEQVKAMFETKERR